MRMDGEILHTIELDVVPHMVFKAKPNGRSSYFNKAWCAYTGMSVDLSENSDWCQAIHPEDLVSVDEVWKSSLLLKQNSKTECRVKDKIGQYRWFLIHLSSELDSNGNILAWLGTCTDVQAFHDLNLKRAEFLSLASHELRTPLTSIMATLQLLEAAILKGAALPTDLATKLIQTGVKSASRLNFLLDDLLSFSNVQSGRLNIEPKRSDLAEAVREAVSSHLSTVQATNRLQLIAELPDQLEGFWDIKRLRQVVDNLLGNAVKYSPQKGKIQISLKREGKDAVLIVQDEGIGIADEDKDRIFKPFERAVKSKNFGGFGLGLYVSSRIVKQHAGRIEVISEMGKGSSFTVRLPVIESV